MAPESTRRDMAGEDAASRSPVRLRARDSTKASDCDMDNTLPVYQLDTALAMPVAASGVDGGLREAFSVCFGPLAGRTTRRQCHNGGERRGGRRQPRAARPDHRGRQRTPVRQPRIQVIGGRARNTLEYIYVNTLERNGRIGSFRKTPKEYV